MKKSALLAMPKLTATPEMKQAAIADEPKQHEGPYGYRYVERTYYPYMNCVVQDGILKAAFICRNICGWMATILLMKCSLTESAPVSDLRPFRKNGGTPNWTG